MYSYLHQFRLLELSVRKVLSGRLLGNYKSAFHGKGLEFQEFRTREEGEDSSGIDWLISSREGRIVVRRMQEERNLSVLQVVDTSLFFDSFLSKEKKEVLEKILFFTSFSAVENADRVAMYLFSDVKTHYFPYSKKKSQLFQIYSVLQAISPSNLSKSVIPLSHIRVKNNLIFYYTDSFQIDVETLKVLAFQNDIIVVHIFHSFENTLRKGGKDSYIGGSNGQGISGGKDELGTHGGEREQGTHKGHPYRRIFGQLIDFPQQARDKLCLPSGIGTWRRNDKEGNSQEENFLFSSSGGGTLPINISDEAKRKEYEVLRKEKIDDFSRRLRRIGIDYLCLDETDDVANECMKFMKKRERQ